MKNKIYAVLILSLIFMNFNFFKKFHLDKKKIKTIIKKSKANYILYIKKKQFKLFVIDKNLHLIKIYNIALGKKKDFGKKFYTGDKATPEGIYKIIEILIATAPTNTFSYKKLKKMNSVYFKSENGFYKWGKPWKDLGRNAYGKAFYRLNYPNKDDEVYYKKMKRLGLVPRNKNGEFHGPGSGIGIHGTNDPPSIGHLISSGCIRMHNEDILQLRHYIKINTPVIIEK